MLTHLMPTVWLAERAAADGGPAGAATRALAQLRRLGLADFAEVLRSLPVAELPALSAALPRMADEESQRAFNGGSGKPLLQDSVSFVRMVAERSRDLRHAPLRDARILDFGFGWGRLLRLFLYYTDPQKLYGVDPMPRALEICREHGVLGTLSQSDHHPASLPTPDGRYDVIYAYSVFTHLSLRAMDTALAALRGAIADDGLLIATIRPMEFWASSGAAEANAVLADHLQHGFAYRPYNLAPIDGDIPYGDTSLDVTWFTQRYPQWELRGMDRGQDEYQVGLLLTPR